MDALHLLLYQILQGAFLGENTALLETGTFTSSNAEYERSTEMHFEDKGMFPHQNIEGVRVRVNQLGHINDGF